MSDNTIKFLVTLFIVILGIYIIITIMSLYQIIDVNQFLTKIKSFDLSEKIKFLFYFIMILLIMVIAIES